MFGGDWTVETETVKTTVKIYVFVGRLNRQRAGSSAYALSSVCVQVRL